MKSEILRQLQKIEETQHVKILLAVESGSRAWGFESPDSDYDVRFIYVRPQREYLRLDERRDVIELPINDLLDINGWDLTKTLKLLYKSNPTLFEWFSSPIVYREDIAFCQEFRPLMQGYFSSKNGLYHYLSMAKNNYREFLRGDMVKLKKYFYVLRPILACRWILDKGTPPPMRFDELMDTELEPVLKPEVERLLDLKMNSPEVKLIPRVDVLNEYMETSMDELSRLAEELPSPANPGWDNLNNLFQDELKRQIDAEKISAQDQEIERRVKGQYLPIFLPDVKEWAVETAYGVERGSLSYVLSEFCGMGRVFQYNGEGHGKHPEYWDHCHEFDGVLIAILHAPASFSIEGCEKGYSAQELMQIQILLNAVMKVRQTNRPLSLDEIKENIAKLNQLE